MSAAYLVFVLFPLSILLHGFLVSQFWAWFVVPLGLPPVSLLHAVGLSCIVACYSGRPEGSGSEFAVSKTIELVVFSIILYVFGGLVAWVM